jgi:hypothetical protein
MPPIPPIVARSDFAAAKLAKGGRLVVVGCVTSHAQGFVICAFAAPKAGCLIDVAA